MAKAGARVKRCNVIFYWIDILNKQKTSHDRTRRNSVQLPKPSYRKAKVRPFEARPAPQFKILPGRSPLQPPLSSQSRIHPVNCANHSGIFPQNSNPTPLGSPTLGTLYPNQPPSPPSPSPSPSRFPLPLPSPLPSHPPPVLSSKNPLQAPHAVSHGLPGGASISVVGARPGALDLA